MAEQQRTEQLERRRRLIQRGVQLMILGFLVGVLFVVWDTARPRPVTPTPTPDLTRIAAEANATTPPEAAPTIAATPTQTPFPDFQPEIPPDTTLFIPSAGIYTNIVRAYLDGYSWDVSRLGTNVGHLQGTAWLGQTGNVVLSGHVELADGRQGIFANLDEVRTGDLIVLEMEGTEYRYLVTSIGSTTPEDLSPLSPSSTDRLTLITCGNYDFFRDSYLIRTVITAERIG